MCSRTHLGRSSVDLQKKTPQLYSPPLSGEFNGQPDGLMCWWCSGPRIASAFSSPRSHSTLIPFMLTAVCYVDDVTAPHSFHRYRRLGLGTFMLVRNAIPPAVRFVCVCVFIRGTLDPLELVASLLPLPMFADVRYVADVIALL